LAGPGSGSKMAVMVATTVLHSFSHRLALASTPCVEVATSVCLPFCSNGDVMHHTPSVNDTTASLQWLAAGGRGLDSAWSYDENGPSQRDTGLAIARSGIPRDQIFVTTKIPCGATPNEVTALIQYDLTQLMLKQVDLLLIHHPTRPACNSTQQITVTWLAMEAALAQGLTRSIGVSNFKPADLDALLAAPTTRVTPAVNQILLHIGAVDTDTISYCNGKGINVMAYSPLGHPDGGGQPVYDLPAVQKVAAAHNVTGAQVALKWVVQHGWPFVTASPTLQYDREDLAVTTLRNLTAAEMATLDAVDQ